MNLRRRVLRTIAVRATASSMMCVALFAASLARGGENEGEPRTLTRDIAGPYQVVAGEANGAATVMNPANLGFLRGINGILDLRLSDKRARLRDDGVGAYIGVPLPFRIATLGFGYQFLWPRQPSGPQRGSELPGTSDESFGKLSFALAVPLERWVAGLSAGVSYGRLISKRNFAAHGLNQVDLAIAYWINRFVSLGFVARSLNQPNAGSGDDVAAQPMTLDPEIALRPLGSQLVEFAVGSRVHALGVPAQARYRVPIAEPRGRVLVTLGGFRLYAEVERFRYFPVLGNANASVEPLDSVRLSSGVEFNLPHFGLGGGPVFAAGGGTRFAAVGGAARLRLSRERYDGWELTPRKVTRIALVRYKGDRGVWRVVSQLEALADRGGVVLLETQGMSLGWAQAEEIREAMLRVRSRGGKVVAYIQGGDLKRYFLASAADRIYANPDSGLDIIGLSKRTRHYAELLAKLGAKAEFVRVAEYKAFPEVVHRSDASEPVAFMRRQLLTDRWNHVVRLIARERGHDVSVVARWVDAAPLRPAEALRFGIVDALLYADELDTELERWLGQPVRVDTPSDLPQHRHEFGPKRRIAVVFIEGDLVNGDSLSIPLLGRNVAGSETITKTIAELEDDDNVAAVVVRVDSPGGMISSAQAIARSLDLVRAKKPVVISMGDICASGGYHIATSGQYIFADATTVTGAIGVFDVKMDLSGFAAKVGLGIDEIGLGARSLMRSWWKPYTEDERAAVMADMRASYAIFVGRVARARSYSDDQVDAVSRGREWSGARAIEVGLVDAYGGLREAILRAKAMAGLRWDQGEVVLLPEPPSILDQVRSVFGLRVSLPFVHARGAASATDLTALSRHPWFALLRELPAALWMLDAPEPLELNPESFTAE